MERNARKTYIVLFCVKESKSVDASERKVDNTEVLWEICDELQVHVDIKQIKRLGRKTDTDWPMLATLEWRW